MSWARLLVGGVTVLAVAATLISFQDSKPPPKKSKRPDAESNRTFEVKSKLARKVLSLADQYIQSGELQKAIARYDSMIKKLAGSTEAAAFHYQRGCIRAHQKMYTLALADGEEVVRLKPHLPHGFSLRAYALLYLERLEESAKDYEKASELEAECERKRSIGGKKAKCKKWATSSLHIPNLWGNYTSKEKIGDTKEIREESDFLKKGNEIQLEGRSSIVSIASENGTQSSRRPVVRRKKRVSIPTPLPNAPLQIYDVPLNKIMLVAVIDSLGKRYLAVGQYAKAAEHLKRTLVLAPKVFGGDWITHKQLAQCYLSMGDGEAAFASATLAKTYNSLDAQAFYMCGESLLLLNRPEEAAKELAQAILLNPGYGEAKRRLDELKRI